MIPRSALAAIATTAAATTLLYNQNKPPKQPPPTEYIATSAIEAEMPKLHQKPTLPTLMKPCSFQRLETPSKQLAIDSISLALALFYPTCKIVSTYRQCKPKSIFTTKYSGYFQRSH